MADLVIQTRVEGTSIRQLTADEVIIGRHTDCNIVLRDDFVSRRHSRIRRRPDGFHLEDLGSSNGTFLNGQRIDGSTRLKHGDQIQFREANITFVDEVASRALVNLGRASDDQLTEEEFWLPPKKDQRKREPIESVTEVDLSESSALGNLFDQRIRLRALIEIIRDLDRAIDGEEVFVRILDSVGRMLPVADRTAVFEQDVTTGELTVAAITQSEQQRGGPADDAFCLSMARQAFQQGKAVLRRAPRHSGRGPRTSPAPDDISYLCAPLIGPSHARMGVIYVDTLEGTFGNEDLDLLACIGMLAGQAIEHSRLHAARYHALVDTAVDGIISFSANRVIESANPAMERLFGYQQAELVGKELSVLLAQGESPAQSGGAPAAPALPPRGEGREVIGRRKDGSTFPLDLSIGEFRLAGEQRFTGILHDMTDRQRAEDALRTSRDRLTRMLQTEVVAIAFVDAQGRIFEANSAFQALTGYSEEEIGARTVTWKRLNAGEQGDRQRKAAERLLNFGQLGPDESQCVCKDGTLVPVILSAARISPPQTREEYVAFIVDNTERKRAEDELKALNETLERRVHERTEYVRLLQDVAVIANGAETVNDAFQAALARICRCEGWAFGRVLLPRADDSGAFEPAGIESATSSLRSDGEDTAPDVAALDLGRSLVDLVVETRKPQWIDRLQRASEASNDDQAPRMEFRSALAFPVVVGEQVCGVFEFFSTQAERPSAELLEVMAHIGTQLGRVAERRRLQQELVDAVWQQQCQFGQELHDSLGQEIGGIRMMADSLRYKLESQSLPETANAAEITKLLHDAQNRVRRLTKGLFPVEVDSEGLMAALSELAETVSAQSGKQCVFRCEQTVEVAGNDVATHLFRIAQEAINNAVRHSLAQRITIWLRSDGDCLVLEVRDDGIGIRNRAVDRSDGIGLRIMRYRAHAIGGTLHIQTHMGGGTLVTCRVRDGESYARHAAPRSADLYR